MVENSSLTASVSLDTRVTSLPTGVILKKESDRLCICVNVSSRSLYTICCPIFCKSQVSARFRKNPLKSSRRNRIPAFKIPLKSFCLKTFRSLEVSFCAPSLT